MTGKPNKPGGGRPKGSVNKRTLALRSISNQAALDGITPVEVMLEKMRFYHHKADVLLTAILAGIEDKKKPLELLKALKELGSFDDKVLAWASEAAPYVHSRLSSTSADVTVTHKVEEAEHAFKTIEGSLEAMINGEIIPDREKSKSKVAA